MKILTPSIFVATGKDFDAISQVETNACQSEPWEAWTDKRYFEDISLIKGYLPLVARTTCNPQSPVVSWGVIHFHPSIPKLRVIRLATHWDFRRQGYARAIIRAGIEYGHKTMRRSYEQLTATVMGGNVTAEMFFHRLKWNYTVKTVDDGSIVTKFRKEI